MPGLPFPSTRPILAYDDITERMKVGYSIRTRANGQRYEHWILYTRTEHYGKVCKMVLNYDGPSYADNSTNGACLDRLTLIEELKYMRPNKLSNEAYGSWKEEFGAVVVEGADEGDGQDEVAEGSEDGHEAELVVEDDPDDEDDGDDRGDEDDRVGHNEEEEQVALPCGPRSWHASVRQRSATPSPEPRKISAAAPTDRNDSPSDEDETLFIPERARRPAAPSYKAKAPASRPPPPTSRPTPPLSTLKVLSSKHKPTTTYPSRLRLENFKPRSQILPEKTDAHVRSESPIRGIRTSKAERTEALDRLKKQTERSVDRTREDLMQALRDEFD